MPLSRPIPFVLFVTMTACAGEIAAPAEEPAPSLPPGGQGRGPRVGPGDVSAPTSACAAEAPGAEALRRLSPQEYQRTVRDLFGGIALPDATVGEVGGAFDADTLSQAASPLYITQVDEASAKIAAAAVKNLPALLGCEPAAAESDACVEAFVGRFGKRAFRRPLDPAEIRRYTSVYATQKARLGPAAAVELLLRAFLSAPSFLYHVEVGAGPGHGGASVRLSPFEVANRLSYFLWGTMPDAALFAAAESGALGTREGLLAQARRLLADSRATEASLGFYAAWLNLDLIESADKDLDVNKGFALEMRPMLRKEIDLLLDDVLTKGDGRLSTLLTAGHTFVNERLDAFYGMGAAVKGAELRRVNVDVSKRPGILTRAGLMAALANRDQSSPVVRGGFVREHLFCQEPPPPPNDVEVTAPSIKPGATTKERFAQHTESPTCRSCHMLMDPLGFGFENFDAVGRWRDTDQGRSVDATGEVVGTEDADGPYAGPAALVDRLARSRQVARCAVTYWFRYAHRRQPTAGDKCTVAGLQAAFMASQGDLSQLPLMLVQTDAFLHRTPSR